MMRNITTYSTLGDNMKVIQSAATTLGELRPDLDAHGVRYQGMKLMTNPGQVTLESLQAQLPEGEFQLFLMPDKVKSGILGDEYMIDEEEGIEWTDEDWSQSDPEEFEFATGRDLAIARAKRALYLLDKAVSALAHAKSSNKSTSSSDPVLNNLRSEAARLQRNMEMFD